MALPATLTRQYYRERTNPRLYVSSQAGTAIGRCGKGSRWLRTAFDVMDWHRYLRVVPSAQQKQFLFYVDDNLRTVQATWLGKNWSTDAVETTYYICGVVEKVGGKLELGHGEKFKKCPQRWVTGTAEMGITNAENPPVKLLKVSEDALVYPDADVMSQVYPHNPDVFIMTQPPPGCAKSFLKVHHGSKSFLQVCKTYVRCCQTHKPDLERNARALSRLTILTITSPSRLFSHFITRCLSTILVHVHSR